MEDKVITVTEANLYVLSEVVKDDLVIGDRVVRLVDGSTVSYTKMNVPKGSHINPITLARSMNKYREAYRELANL